MKGDREVENIEDLVEVGDEEVSTPFTPSALGRFGHDLVSSRRPRD